MFTSFEVSQECPNTHMVSCGQVNTTVFFLPKNRILKNLFLKFFPKFYSSPTDLNDLVGIFKNQFCSISQFLLKFVSFFLLNQKCINFFRSMRITDFMKINILFFIFKDKRVDLWFVIM